MAQGIVDARNNKCSWLAFVYAYCLDVMFMILNISTAFDNNVETKEHEHDNDDTHQLY